MTAKFLVVLAAMASAASANFAGHGRHPPMVASTMCDGIPAGTFPYGREFDYSGCSTRNIGCALTCTSGVVGRWLSLSCAEQANGTYMLVPTIPGFLPSCSAAPPPPPVLLCTLDCGVNGECGFVGAEQRCFCSNGFYGLACEFDAAAQIGNLTVALEDCNTNFTLCETDLALCEANLTLANTNYGNSLTVLGDLVNNVEPGPSAVCNVLVGSALADLDFSACGVQVDVPALDPIGGTNYYLVPLTANGALCIPTSVACGAGTVVINPVAPVCAIVAGVAAPPTSLVTVTCT